MKNKRILYVVQLSLGIALLFLGALVFTSDNQRLLSGLCYGVGSAILVLASGNLFFSFRISEAENEKIQQLKQIEVNDERNTRIREKTGQKVAQDHVLCTRGFCIAHGIYASRQNYLIYVCLTADYPLYLIDILFQLFFEKGLEHKRMPIKTGAMYTLLLF